MKQTTLNIIGIFIIAAFSSGCAVYDPVADFTKQRYINSISYFNTFYNAQRLFSEAENEVIQAKRDFAERPAANRAFTIPATARQKFQTSIEKNSKILSFYPNSKWVDDALMMIGKSYFYMEDDVRAERKFLELLAQFPDGDYILESQLWLGKSYIRQKKTDAGLKLLDEVYSRSVDMDEEIAGLSAYEIAQHYFNQEEFVKAEQYYANALKYADDDDLVTQIYFQLGKCYTALEQYEKAERSYEIAANTSPLYTLIFQASLQRIKSSANQKKYDEAIEKLSEMLRDTKNFDFYGIIHFEIANILYQQKKYAEAIEKFRYVDTTFVRTDESARSNYTLAQYYETIDMNYDSVRTLYNKASREFPSSAIAKEAGSKAEIYNKYNVLRNDLSRFDSLLTNILFPTVQIDTTVAQNSAPTILKDSIIPKVDTTVKKNLKTVKQDTKKDSVIAIDSTKIKEKISRELAQSKLVDSLQRSIIRTKFELGGLFFLEILQPDSALYWFNEIVKKSPQSEFAPRSLYTIAEILRTSKGATEQELESHYTEIIKNYPESPYANESRRILNLPVIIAQKDTALILFEQAEILADSKKYTQAIQTFKNISDQYSASTISPKALFTAAWHYENSLLNNDSAYAVYKRLLSKYPSSQFATVARPKVTEFDNEQKRIEQEKQKEIDAKKMKEQQEKEEREQKKQNIQPQKSDTLSTPKN